MVVNTSPIQARVAGIFIPVRDIERAREWYCRIFGIAETPEIMNGHLCPLPTDGPGIILDTMPMWGGKEEGGPSTYDTPAAMFPTDDLEGAYKFMQEQQVEFASGIEFNHWFAFRDSEGNLLMVVKA